MDLHSGIPYWLIKDGIQHFYPPVELDLITDVAIIGGGISGAMCAYHLQNAGINCVVIDRRHCGTGSTCASTGLLLAEIDTELAVLCEKFGKDDAMFIYRSGIDAIHKIAEIDRKCENKGEFVPKKNLYAAFEGNDIKRIEQEFRLRTEAGNNCRLFYKDEICSDFSFEAEVLIASDESAQLNAYAFTKTLLNEAVHSGTSVCEKTEVVSLEYGSKIRLNTNRNFSVYADHYIVATGYELSHELSVQYSKLHSTYAIVSEPMDHLFPDFLLWETRRPYLYLRPTVDNRIIVGGRDVPFKNASLRDSLMVKKSEQLEKDFHQLFPEQKFTTDFTWNGTFAETADGLPYIGKHKNYPGAYFALGYAGNGITFSLIAAECIRDDLLGKQNDGLRVYAFDR